MKIAIIGAGPAGLTAAYELSKGGAQVELFEASASVGGLAQTIELWGQLVDLGPHRFFSQDARVNRLWLEVVGKDYRMVDRLTRIYYQSRLYHYPLRPGNALLNMGPIFAAACMVSYLKEKISPSEFVNLRTFEAWVVGRFGRRLFEMFFKSYSEKLWGIPCDQLDADFAAQRIKRFSLGEAVKSALGLGRHKHKTLVDRFAYPIGGTGMIYEKMAAAITTKSGRIHVRTPVSRVTTDGFKVTGLELKDGVRVQADQVISTMPLTLLARQLGDCPVPVIRAIEQLTYRNTILVYLHVDDEQLFADQWLYIHSPELRFGRLTNYRNWVPEIVRGARGSILSLEYWCYNGDDVWNDPDEKLVQRAKTEIRATGLIKDAEILGGHVVKLPRCYPVYAAGYSDHLKIVSDYVRSFSGLQVIGRYGAFKYNNQDHSILMGLLAAENVQRQATHDLWEVNSDYESYQEAATIDEAGLHPVERS